MFQEIKSIYIETYGCTANQNNTEILKRQIIDAGLNLTNNTDLADILILNTCIVKGPTENKMIQRIKDLSREDKILIVTGCMPDSRKDYLEKNYPEIFLLSVHQIKNLRNLIRDIIENSYNIDKYTKFRNEIKLGWKLRNNKYTGITQISEGCDGNCNYCIVKKSKGKLFSYPEKDILNQIEADLKSGCKEIYITSQDNASYGLDTGKQKLINLLNQILNLNYNFKLRLGMTNPNHILPILNDLIELYKNKKMYKFLHIPIQSGSDNILKLMNRKYTIKQAEKIITEFEKSIPNINIATDIIISYPGETKEDFNLTKDFLIKHKFDIVNLSKFWAIKGTQAEKEKQIPVKEAKKRVSELQKIQTKILDEKNKKYENKEMRILIYDSQGKLYFGRTENYKICIVSSKTNILGKSINVKIKETHPRYMKGELIN